MGFLTHAEINIHWFSKVEEHEGLRYERSERVQKTHLPELEIT